MDKPTIDEQFPNLSALAQGAMSGNITEWPQLRVETERILQWHKRITESVSEQILQNQIAEADRRAAERDAAVNVLKAEGIRPKGKSCLPYIIRAITAERQLAELQAEHDALVKRLREPVEEYLNINDLWKKSEDDAEGMDLGHPTQAHYFAALLQQAMSAVALDEKGGE